MFNKKPKTEEQFTPSDLNKLSDKGSKEALKGQGIFKRFSARRSAEELSKTQLWRRRGFWVLVALVIILLIMFIISMLISQYGDLVISIERRSAEELSKTQIWRRRGFWALVALVIILLIMFIISMLISQYGDLVISIERSARGKGITVSETPNLDDGVTILSAEKVVEVTNITYEWLPLEELDTKEGSYNGKNYLAYTFYLQNNGTEEVDYTGQLQIKGVSKSMDEAVRVMVYKNGEPAIYGKQQYKGTEPETDCTAFESENSVMSTMTENFKPGDMDKYTIVSWVEGNDPECVDDIMGGFMRMNMLFSIADEEEE